MGKLSDLSGRAAATVAISLLALVGFAAGHAAAEEFRLLRVDERLVRWTPAPGSTPLALTYAIADRTVPGGSFGTCESVGSPGPMLTGSGLTMTDLEMALRRAMMLWQRDVNVNFVPAQSAAEAQIVVGAAAPARGIAFTDLNLVSASQSPAGTRTIIRSVICLNPEKLWKVDLDTRIDRFELETVLAHELGHVLGLDHPSAQGHVMSFRYSESNRGLTDGDRNGAIRLYGSRRPIND